MKYPVFFFLLCLTFACPTKKSNKVQQAVPVTQQQPKAEPAAHRPTKIDTITVFTDSLHVARRGRNKVFLASVLIDDSIPKAYLRFYSKEKNAWKLDYSFEDEHWSGENIDPEITDFNNDGYKDFKYRQGSGARGGNGTFNLFIYDKKGDSLIYITNSNDYPNLYFNRQLKSINSYILTGGNETVFMRLDSNRLKPFASIFQYGDEVTVTEYDKTGKSRVIKVDTSGRYDEYARFTNYKPLTVEK